MNYAGITHEDVVNGEGIRVVLWLSGCSHHCPGCHNPETWNPSFGKPFDNAAKKEIFDELDHSWSDGITISGGDPLHENNLDDLYELLKEITEKYPDKTIWLYTGYLFEDILTLSGDLMKKRRKIVGLCDVLIDGPFVAEFRDISLPWRGSPNQRLINAKESIAIQKAVIIPEN